MAKKSKKQGTDKIIKDINKEFEKTSSKVEKMVGKALKKLESFQAKIQEPIRKMAGDLDRVRERELKRLNAELDRRRDELYKFRENMLERLGVAARDAKKKAKKSGKKIKSDASLKVSDAMPAEVAEKVPTPNKTPKPATPSATKTPKPKKDRSDLTQVKGIGPATEKKLKDAGITTIDQIANPSTEDLEKLKAFSSSRGFSNWSTEARKVT
jgi:predicted flap endonuclease-1-like 5' DNA nuclease